MAFLNHDVMADEDFSPEADPVLRRLEAKRLGVQESDIRRTAGAAVLQDIALKTYWANTVGKTKYPGTYHLYKEELRDNMQGLMRSRMNYRQLEEFLTVVGYEAGDIRCVFRELTGLDATKLEHMRQEYVNLTPANVPWYNCAWGYSKKKDVQSYFVMPGGGNLYTVWAQVDDMTRKDVGSFIVLEEAVEYIKAFCSKVYRYDQPVNDQIDEALKPWKDESTKKEYMVMANLLHDQRKRGILDVEVATRAIHDAYVSGTFEKEEAEDLLDLYVNAGPEEAKDQVITEPAPGGVKNSPDLDYRQDNSNVGREVEQVTPQDFFESVLPDRMDTITPQHIKDVLSYIEHRGADMSEFEVKLHSLEYMKHKTPQSLIETNPQNGRPSGPPRATISVILELVDKTIRANNKKFALAVFFVNPDGDIGTSDSVKGEDDIIYGFSEDGMRQYFSRDRMVHGDV